MIEEKQVNLCESCEHVRYLTVIDPETKKEVRAYDCPCAEKHTYPIEKCSNYSRPNGFTRFMRNKLAVTFTGLILLGLIVFACVLILK